MKAVLLIRDRLVLDADAFVELIVWRLPQPLAGSAHDFKYRLALISKGVCVVRYDNEAGKGDHKHLGDSEIAYGFKGVDRLQSDFWNDVRLWRSK